MQPEQPNEPVITTEPAKIDLRRRPRAVPDWSGRGMKRRLMVLVGGLLLVLVLMERVRDPELWRKIGFTEQPPESGPPATTGQPGEWTEIRLVPQDDGPANEDNLGNQEPSQKAGSENLKTSESAQGQLPEGRNRTTGDVKAGDNLSLESTTPDAQRTIEQLETSDNQLDRQLASDLEQLERTKQEFWYPLLDRLSAVELKGIAARRVACEALTGEEAAALAMAIRKLDSAVPEHSLKGLEELARHPESDARSAAVERLAEGPNLWRDHIRPWLVATPDDPDRWWGTEKVIADFGQALVTVAKSRIEDRTGPARAEEAAVMLLTCHSWQPDVIPVGLWTQASDTYTFMTRPEALRGYQYIFNGVLRGIEPVPVRPGVLKIERLWALWIAPNDGSSVPLCVYTPKLPQDWKPDANRFTPFDVPVEVYGYFFKLRTYTDTNRQQAVCPLIFAYSVFPDFHSAQGENNSAPVASPWTQLAWWLLPLILVAAAVSWLATVPLRRKNRFAPRGDRAALRQLELDPSIVSDRERVARLEREGT